ncbi:MFS transporter [Luteolibacter arcticus]|uniref:MFS transporter n=1 Tax=Luteolibacter arcticus TaxID=1581411 RepID=A0ABT3GJU5_9BACT|nr:MFS transporter [Luteolibacter arcticus]MCW1923773.1 MFS transporter [Luteolibacter arcticus]
MEKAAPSAVTTRLSVMMFLQFFLWGAWFVTLGACLDANGLASIIGAAYGSAPIAAIIAPLFLGLVADRFFPSEKVMGVLLLIGGAAMLAVPGLAAKGDAEMVKNLFILHMLCYMPTLGLGNSIAFANISDQSKFPALRVWGTIGWIVAGLITGFMGWSKSLHIFTLAGGTSLLLGAFSFFLPTTPPPAKGQPLKLSSIFMLDAFKLLAKPAFFIFILCSTLICIPLAYYYSTTSIFLSDMGFRQPASSMSIGQMSEIVFMLLIPFFFRKLGVKWMILIGMAAWVLRYVLFAFAAPDQVVWMLFLAIALHGICYDFFFVTGFIYADKAAPVTVRSQVQSMLVFFTQGIGMYFGYKIADARMKVGVGGHAPLAEAIQAGSTGETPSFAQQLGQMFSVGLPKVDATLLSTASTQWKAFWLLPAGMAAVIAVLFLVAFWDKSADGGDTKH